MFGWISRIFGKEAKKQGRQLGVGIAAIHQVPLLAMVESLAVEVLHVPSKPTPPPCPHVPSKPTPPPCPPPPRRQKPFASGMVAPRHDHDDNFMTGVIVGSLLDSSDSSSSSSDSDEDSSSCDSGDSGSCL